MALREYLSASPDGRFKIGGGYLRNQPHRGDGAGAPPSEQVLDMLRRDAAEPQEPVVPDYVKPLLPRETAYGVSPFGNREPSRR